MPKLLSVITVIGTVAMLWVGGHILLVGTHDLGFDPVYDFVHHLEEGAHEATGALGGVVGWLVNTFFSAVIGLVVGGLVVLVLSQTLHRRKGGHGEDPADGDAHDAAAHDDGTAHTSGATKAPRPGGEPSR